MQKKGGEAAVNVVATPTKEQATIVGDVRPAKKGLTKTQRGNLRRSKKKREDKEFDVALAEHSLL
eukprot:125008-Prorocentrum_lima.AAC.1